MSLRSLSDRSPFARRQGVLFLIAIVIPCVLLVGLSLRMLRQERELAKSRAAEGRRQLTERIRQHLLTSFERVRLDALSDRPISDGAAAGTGQDALALVARLDHDEVVLPWDRRARASHEADPSSPFAAALGEGDREEFASQYDRSVEAYGRAIALASVPEQRASALLALARTLKNAGRSRESFLEFRSLLQRPVTLVDDEAVPFALYAAGQLLAKELTPPSERQAVRVEVVLRLREAADVRTLSPAALYMADDLVTRLAASPGSALAPDSVDLGQRIARRRTEVEQAEALRTAYPKLTSGTTFSAADPIWLPFEADDRMWLVTVSPTPEGDERVLIAVRPEPALAPLNDAVRFKTPDFAARVSLNVRGEGDALGRNFPRLSVVVPVNGVAGGEEGRVQRAFYFAFAALLLVLSVTLTGGYLFWRDVQRDVRMSNLRSQFVSSVSHELKTPLTAIRMFAETLRMGRAANPVDRDEYLDTIVNESERLTRLLNNVLDFSKIEQGRKNYRLDPHPLAAVVRSAARTMQYPLAQQGFELRVDIDDSLPAVRSDPDALEQAILNLLSNAMKYSDSGRVIDLTLRRSGRDAVIAVKDRGFGIPAEEQGKIFEKFYRVVNPNRQLIAGTGLGLTLVEHTVRAHGGRVTVESAPGHGSTFSIVLPIESPLNLQSSISNLQSQVSGT